MKTENNQKLKFGLAIASLVSSLCFFIPVLGVMTGITAIILGIVSLLLPFSQNSKSKYIAFGGIALGLVGIVFTVGVYASLFKTVFNPAFQTDEKKELIQGMLERNVISLEEYRQKYGIYPDTLEDAVRQGFNVPFWDPFNQPLYYEVSQDKHAYTLLSLGPDKKLGTADDIPAPRISDVEMGK